MFFISKKRIQIKNKQEKKQINKKYVVNWEQLAIIKRGDVENNSNIRILLLFKHKNIDANNGCSIPNY